MATAKNALFISVDDLNNWTGLLGGYGGVAHTPNLDALMQSGTTFSNAYAQVPLCNPSRTSVLNGEHPLTSGVVSNEQVALARSSIEKSIPVALRGEGFSTASFGKVYSVAPHRADQAAYFDAYSREGLMELVSNGLLTFGALSDFNLAEEELIDFQTTEAAVNYLGDVDPNGQPFYVQVGFFQPHAQWLVPQEFLDLYPIDEIVLPTTRRGHLEDISDYARALLPDDHPTFMEHTSWQEMIQAYLASISYMDSKLGELMAALEATGAADDTLIVLWSDHGYHLGDRESHWSKFTLWEEAANAPLMFAGPGVPVNQIIDAPVELLDIYPTVMDMLGVAQPSHLEGESLQPLIAGDVETLDRAAITWMYGSYSVRDETHRYIRYVDGSEELYDMVADPAQAENLIGQPGAAAIAADLRAEAETRYNIEQALTPGETVVGGDGADVLTEFAAGTTLEGGAGDDTYFVHNHQVVGQSFRPHTHETTIVEWVGGGKDTVYVTNDFSMPKHVENLTFTYFDENHGDRDYRFIGNAADNRFILEGGRNFVHSGGGDDELTLKEGHDIAHGGRGDDVIFGASGNDRLSGGSGDDRLYGGVGNDVLWGFAGNDELFGGAGDDHMSGGGGVDRLIGSAGKDRLFGRADDDLLSGGDDNDYAHGGQGDDALFGGRGNDILIGGLGDDRLFGGEGADRLFGGLGADEMSGGDGADMFVFNVGDGADRILDFQLGVDRLLSRSAPSDFEVVDIGGDLVLRLNDSDALTLVGQAGADPNVVF